MAVEVIGKDWIGGEMPTKRLKKRRKRRIPVKDAVNTERHPDGKFKKGFTANPNGRPRKGETLTDILREYGEKRMTLNGRDLQLKEHLARTVYLAVILGYRIVEGKKTKLNDSAWAKLLEWLYDRVDGKPTEKLQIGSPEVEVTSEDMTAAMEELALWKKHRAKK